MSKKPRLDELLVSRGLFDNVHDARAAVLAGEVVVGEQRETSAGRRLDADVPIRLKAGKAARRGGFASRGGRKLQAALDVFGLDVNGMHCVDLGASTGGFTDCLLQHGAASVAAVDVGYGQFDWNLRNDDRVRLYERTNVRGIDPSAIGAPFDLAVSDLSFIRIETVLPDVRALLADDGLFVALVKPQFEVERESLGEHGVVDDARVHADVIERVVSALPRSELVPHALGFSPVKGPEGNIEFLLLARRLDSSDALRSDTIVQLDIEDVVQRAHETLGGRR